MLYCVNIKTNKYYSSWHTFRMLYVIRPSLVHYTLKRAPTLKKAEQRNAKAIFWHQQASPNAECCCSSCRWRLDLDRRVDEWRLREYCASSQPVKRIIDKNSIYWPWPWPWPWTDTKERTTKYSRDRWEPTSHVMSANRVKFLPTTVVVSDVTLYFYILTRKYAHFDHLLSLVGIDEHGQQLVFSAPVLVDGWSRVLRR